MADRSDRRPAAARRAPLLRVSYVLAGVLLASACLGGRAGPTGPVVSPTGIVYEPGTPPTDTRFSQTAALYLRSDEPRRALELVREGIATDPGNPIHYFLAGVAHARLESWTEADAAFRRAQDIYPAYELDIELERLAAWAEAFNTGTAAYTDGDEEGAIAYWKGATLMYRLRPEAHRNLGALLAQQGRWSEAAEVYAELLDGLDRRPATRVLSEDEVRERVIEAERAEASLAEVLMMAERFSEAEPLLRRQLDRDPTSVQARLDLATALSRQERAAEAVPLYDDLLADPDISGDQLVALGVALFRSGEPGRAAEAFRRVTETRPGSRDAWYNYANALMAAESWSTLVEIGDRLLEVDPLGENAMLLVARGRLETGDERGALELLERIDHAPVLVDDLVVRRQGAGAILHGRVTGRGAEAGTELRLEVLYTDQEGQERQATVPLRAPPPGETRSFELPLSTPVSEYRYMLAGGR